MMRMTVLASGSRGNSAVISSSGTRILVDAGLSCRETLKRMRFAGEDPLQLQAIVISHEHQDHVNGLPVLARKLNIPVYMTKSTHGAWQRWVSPPQRKFATAPACFASRRARIAPDEALAKPDLTEAAVTLALKNEEGIDGEGVVKNPAELPALELFCSGQSFLIGDIEVTPFTIPHDAADPVAFIFNIEGVKLGVVTDLGYVSENVKVHLRNCDALMIESNHDLEMLREGPYPWSVKQRVLSRVGHLSNAALADFLTRDYDGGAAFLVLAHLSEANNHPELARKCAERALGGRLNLISNRIMLARQSEALESICL